MFLIDLEQIPPNWMRGGKTGCRGCGCNAFSIFNWPILPDFNFQLTNFARAFQFQGKPGRLFWKSRNSSLSLYAHFALLNLHASHFETNKTRYLKRDCFDFISIPIPRQPGRLCWKSRCPSLSLWLYDAHFALLNLHAATHFLEQNQIQNVKGKTISILLLKQLLFSQCRESYFLLFGILEIILHWSC